ncbi:thymine dioxygenase [Pseudovirgaria hyperparasitica]|uniref:Thymine dioxygenase n=1 Tax=Pseudovirgaria hyperparasitica TaxID=470096 RepID=A0A6A6WGU1_9PEZI|nr:thymine dioxygenase [Pseudovirgaria hyperparasitica]KAF2760857.1 thymine dioxygenase [Pseudovirgaria hyperparasitica]
MSPTVPTVDFGKFIHGSPSEKKEVAVQIDDAFRNIGFVKLTNHSVPKDMVQKCFDWSKTFFSLPLESKMLCPHPPGGAHHRGYSALSTEHLTSIPDTKESYESGNPLDAAQPNIWPPADLIPGFQPFMESFFTSCAAFVHILLTALSLALDMDSDLSATHSESLFQLRLLHYPAVARRVLQRNEATRIGAHSDFGTLTLLFQDEVGGLEVESPPGSGTFIGVPGAQGERGESVLVNVGDLLARWSNDRWKSTVHRVGVPPVVEGSAEEDMCAPRYSIPFFATANDDTVIEALPGCWSESNPKKYESVTARGYVQMSMAELY